MPETKKVKQIISKITRTASRGNYRRKRKDIDKLKEQLAETRKELIYASDGISALVAEERDLQKQIDNNQPKLTELEKLTQQINQLKADNKKLKEKRQDSGYGEEEMENEETQQFIIEELHEEIRRLKRLFSEEDGYDNLLFEIEIAWKNLKKQEKKLEEQERELTLREGQINHYEIEVEKIGKWEKKNNNLEIQNKETQQELTREWHGQRYLQLRYQSLQQAKTQLEAENNNLINQNINSGQVITNLQQQLNQAQQVNQNLQVQINQTTDLQRQIDEQRQTNAYLESRVKYLKNELAEERGSNYHSQRSNRRGTRVPQWRGSEDTLFSDESDNENRAGTSSNTKKLPQIPTNSNWKSALWQKTKKLGLTALAAYGSYQVGYNYGSNSCSNQINQPGLAQLNNVSPAPQTCPANQNYSPVKNPLLNPFLENNFHSDLENSTPPPPFLFFPENNLDQLNTVFTKLGMAASIDVANPEPFKEVIAKLADLEIKLGKLDELDPKLGGASLTDIPTNLKDLINQNASLRNENQRPDIAIEEFTHYKSPEQVAEIEKSVREKVQKEFKDYINPNNSTALAENELFTKSQVEQAMQTKAEQKDQEWKNKGLINPQDDNDLLSAQLVKKANLTAAENERDNRPNITLSEYNNLLNNQKPKDLPDNWKNQSAQAAKNQNILDTITNILPELIDEAGKFKEKQVGKILNELKSRPKPADLDNKVNEAIAKYKDYIEPTDTTKIIDIAKTKGYQFQQGDLDQAIKTNNQTWIDKGLINPLNPTELEQAQLVPKTDLLEAQRKIKLAEEFGLTDWESIENQTELETLTLLLARPTRKELEDKQKELVKTNQELTQTNQQVNNLTTQLNKLNSDLLKVKENSRFEIARLESESKNYQRQRDLRPDITFTEYQQLLTDKDEAEKTRETMKIERDDALRSLDIFNDQLNDIYQESVRGKRKERKLNEKLNQKTKPTESFQSFQEQTHTQTNFLHSLFNCLVSAGVGFSGGYASKKAPPKIDLGELEKGINTLIEQKNQFQREKEDWKNKFLSHECEVPTPTPCPHSDIPENNYKPQVEIIQQENEQAIIQELNNTLQLGLGSNPSLKQVISRIQELINKDPVEISTPFGEDLQVIKELEINGLEQLFPNQLETSFLEQIKNAQNYKQLTQIRNEFLAKHLSGEVKQINGPVEINKKNIERYVWISLLASVVVGLVMVIKSLINAKKSKHKVLQKVFKLVQQTRSRRS